MLLPSFARGLLDPISPRDATSDPQREQTWDEGHQGHHHHNSHYGARKCNQTRFGPKEDASVAADDWSKNETYDQRHGREGRECDRGT